MQKRSAVALAVFLVLCLTVLAACGSSGGSKVSDHNTELAQTMIDAADKALDKEYYTSAWKEVDDAYYQLEDEEDNEVYAGNLSGYALMLDIELENLSKGYQTDTSKVLQYRNDIAELIGVSTRK